MSTIRQNLGLFRDDVAKFPVFNNFAFLLIRNITITVLF
jgi:hypothetical protein